MDMKKILENFDSAASGKKTSAGDVSDMKRFVSIIAESSNPYKPVTEKVINSFDEGSIGGDANEFLLAADKINDEVMAQVNKIKINADESLLRDMMDKFNAFMTSYHTVGKEIMQPDMFNDSVQAERTEDDLEQIAKHPAADDPRIQQAVADKKKELDTKEEGIHNGLTFKDYFALEESKKKITASEDPCWKGYKMVGTKKKGGREVPNCVPGKKGD